MQLYCKFCGADFIHVSRTRKAVHHYCPSCGSNWEIPREIATGTQETWEDAVNKKRQEQAKKKLIGVQDHSKKRMQR